ncbi:MAG: hypothetical protein ACPHRO_06010 [Nannocystaceae bacterium]
MCVICASLSLGLFVGLSHAERSSAHGAPLALLKHQRQVSYPFDQVWATTIRYLRIERGFAIDDRDKESGYVVFTFTHGEATGHGSVEFLSDLDDAGRPSVTLISTTSRGPAHLPFAILAGIAEKLRDERGQPIDPPKPPAEEPPEDKAPDEGPNDGQIHDGGSNLRR